MPPASTRLTILWTADAVGTVALLGCLGAGSAYQQAPLRSVPKTEKDDQDLKDVEQMPLVLKAESRV